MSLLKLLNNPKLKMRMSYNNCLWWDISSGVSDLPSVKKGYTVGG